ncbi:hypothetical protein HYQ44_005465 [Verticillium longisporum]|nr:hypothetical protein HYQ44_005465 [Verticillium longisporum]
MDNDDAMSICISPPAMLEAGVRAASNGKKMPADTGLFVVYQPIGEPVLDIILIHGLQGHSFKTWAGEVNPAGTSAAKVDAWEGTSWQSNSQGGSQSASTMKRFLSRMKSTERHSAVTVDEQTSQPFWPSDFLPNDCSEARIMVFGYNTVIQGSPSGVMAQETATKARDLRNPLPWRNVTKRDLGIMFQFALPRGHGLSQKLVGIVFIGSPHRGSWTANVGEIWRKLASFVLMDTNARILHSLCLKNSDPERCQDAFSALWLKYNFRVKTFQEGLPLKLPLRFGQSMMSKVVPDVSSCLGDTRERAEGLDGDHRPICRFSSCSDPNYQKLAAELIEIYDGIVHKVHVWPFDRTASQMTLQDTDPSPKTPIFNIAQKATLNFYAFPEMHFRRLSIDEPVQNTSWLRQVDSDETQLRTLAH